MTSTTGWRQDWIRTLFRCVARFIRALPNRCGGKKQLPAVSGCFAVLLGFLLQSASASDAGVKCRPLISGNLWWITPDMMKGGMSKWRDELDDQQKIGFNILWLCNTASVIDLPGDPLRQLLDLCQKRKVKVVLDAGTSGPWWEPLVLAKELSICTNHIKAIGGHYGGHPAFYAWYLSQEIYMCWGGEADYINHLYPELVKQCKQSANLPVMVSPFFILDRQKIFGDFRFNDPDEYRDYWKGLLKRSGIDIVLLQDSGEHFSYVTIEQRQPFFEAMAQACQQSGAKLWGNVEVAEMLCDSPDEYARKYGRVHPSKASGLPWRAVPMDRLKEKLDLAAQYSDRIVSWGYQEYCRPQLSPVAAKWYQDYSVYYTSGRAKTRIEHK